MMFRLYSNQLKCLIRNKESLFWCLAFPLFLATCFYFAFGNLGNKLAEFETIQVGIVTDLDKEELEVHPLIQIMEQATTGEEEKPLFDLNIDTLEVAKNKLHNRSIVGYIKLFDDLELVVGNEGMKETIMKEFLDAYLQKRNIISNVLMENPNALEEGLLDSIFTNKTYVVEDNTSRKSERMVVLFYSLLAFTCMFSCNYGMYEVTKIQADLSDVAARLNVTKTPKFKLFMCNITAAYTINVATLFILFFYMKDILKINFGEHIVLVILTCLLGSLVGMLFGSAVFIWVKRERNVKEAIVIAINLLFAGLSGLFGTEGIKYLISEKLPLLAYLNPTNLITDSLYSLYYYDTLKQFTVNILLLVAMAIVLCGITLIGIRRKNYASI